MSDDKKIQVSGTVAAPPAAVFALLSDPARHTELDGAGMLQGIDSGPSPVSKVGDAFVMNMNQDGIGDYQMRSVITTFEPDRAIAWAPAVHPVGALKHIIGDLDPSGHIYSWVLEPTSDGGTQITHTYDWNGVQDQEALALYPRVSEEQMRGSIANVVNAVS